jgi:hypothetical protein
VGVGEILTEDFIAYAADRSAPGFAIDRSAILDEMIAEESIAQRARTLGLDQTPAFRRALRDFLATRLREAELLPLLEEASAISDPDLEAAVAEAAPRLGQAAARRIAWMRVTFEGGSEAQRNAATTRLAEASEKWRELPPDIDRRGFGTIAAEYSDDPDTRYQGGDLGWVASDSPHTRLPAAASAAAAALQSIGSLTEPVLLADSACILLLQDQRDAQPADPGKIRERVRQELMSSRRAEAEAAWRAKCRNAARVSIDRTKLEQLSLPENPAPPAPVGSGFPAGGG